MIMDFSRRVGVAFTGILLAAVASHETSAAPREAESLRARPAEGTERAGVAKREPKQSDTRKPEPKAEEAKGTPKPEQVGTFGDWGAFVAQGAKDKTCYALAKPKERAPSGLNRDPAYVFISSRPSEKVREEVSIIMGFPMKEDGGAKAEVGGASFDLVVKGPNAWLKNQAEETKFVEALKKGAKLVVRAPSARGRVTTDTYALSGVAQALEKAAKECQ
jgi:hypothetical protein